MVHNAVQVSPRTGMIVDRELMSTCGQPDGLDNVVFNAAIGNADADRAVPIGAVAHEKQAGGTASGAQPHFCRRPVDALVEPRVLDYRS